jgi:hypothetical protein
MSAAAIGMTATVVSTFLSWDAAKGAGKSAYAAGKLTAAQLRRNADYALATSHRQAAEDRRQTELTLSRARASIAASGAMGVGTEELLARIDHEGEYAALTSLFEGKVHAEGLRAQAEAAIAEGKAAKRAAETSAGASLVRGVASLAGGF